MPCKICCDPVTVNSHIIPRALAHDVRGRDTHSIIASRKSSGPKPSQSGISYPNLLCDTHEKQTSVVDKYGIEFVRRIAAEWKNHRTNGSMRVVNPQPEMIRRFALLTIWREVHAVENSTRTLGRFDQAIQDGLFGTSLLPDWPVIVQRTNFVDEQGEPVDYNIYPWRNKIFERNCWCFTAAGVNFFVVSDNRGLPLKFSSYSADTNDPAIVAIPSPLPVKKMGMVNSVIDSMAKNRKAFFSRK
jgi:hypothetical protein